MTAPAKNPHAVALGRRGGAAATEAQRAAARRNGRSGGRPWQVAIDTSVYRRAHGRSPRGRGSWAFHPNPDGPLDDRMIWTQGTYAEARAEAIRIARERRTDRVLFVCS
jgi:hypothetical protein